MYLRKTIRLVVLHKQGVDEGTLRNVLLLREKLGLIKDVDKWLDMRAVRNQIVYEYLFEELQELYEKVENDYFDNLAFTYQKIQKYYKKVST